MARTGLVFYNVYSENPTIELCITVGSNAFPQLQRKTSHLVFLAVYCVCRLYQPDALVTFPEGGQFSYHSTRCQDININLCLIFGQYNL